MFSITLCWLITKYSVYLIAFALPISLAPLYYLSKYAFLGFGLIVNVPLALAILFFSGIATYIIKTFIENIEKRKIQSSFLQYVPADIVKNINKESDVPSLGGEEIEATVFFLDIRGFTSITETLKDDPNLLVNVIGHIMNRVTDILIQHEATIDKYIGDAVMAFWNAPVKVDNHQVKAYKASLAIKKEIPKINAEVKAMLSKEQSKLINVNFGMGLSTGQVVVGNMGSEFRFNYSVMGDMVNVAARLEAMTKEKKKIILAGSLNFSDEMIKNLKVQGIALKFIDDIAVRGKKEKIPVYAVE
jgi:adenylate cyclase